MPAAQGASVRTIDRAAALLRVLVFRTLEPGKGRRQAG